MKGKALTLFYDDSEQSRVRVKGLLGILALVAVFVVGIAGGVTYSDNAVNIKINFFYCLSAFLVLKFEGEKNIAFVWTEATGKTDMLQLEAGRGQAGYCTKNADGYLDLVVEFTRNAGDGMPLQIETWVACSFLVDDIVLSEV